MIYLTFDSNIWIYLMDNSWKEKNPLDYLEHWIEEGYMKILLPEMVRMEWEKHRETQLEYRKKKLNEFFDMAKEILPSDFYIEFNSQDKKDQLIDEQLDRVQRIIENSESVSLSTDSQQKLISWGVAKKAPMHSKSSVADAIIILSLFEFAENNTSNTYYFVSANTTDFYSKANNAYTIHPDLLPDFQRLAIKDYRELNVLIHHLKEELGLPVTISMADKRKDRIQNRLKRVAFNPVFNKGLENIDDTYLENTKLIDVILQSTGPTQQQVQVLLGLIQTPDIEEYFWRNVSSPFWFKILNEHGYFDSANNPAPVQMENGYRIPYWKILTYLIKLSEQIKNGQSQELINHILSVIEKVSKDSIDNHRTWQHFIRFISNFPNDQIPLKIIEFAPKWISGQFKTSYQLNMISDLVLPKFLNDAPTSDDIAKANFLLKYMLSVDKRELDEIGFWNNTEHRFSAKIDAFHVPVSIGDSELQERIVTYCDPDLIPLVASSLNKILIDFPKGINGRFQIDSHKIALKIHVEEDDLILQFVENEDISSLKTYKIVDFTSLDDDALKAAVISFLKEFGYTYDASEVNESQFEYLFYGISADTIYAYEIKSIADLSDNDRYNSNSAANFALILRDLLIELCKHNASAASNVLKQLLTDKKYYLPIYKRIALFVIGEFWSTQKQLFWELIQNSDEKGVFQTSNYQLELFSLLDKNKNALTLGEQQILKEVIAKGPDPESDDEPAYWKFRILTALEGLEEFQAEYELLNEKFNKTKEDFLTEGEIKVTMSTGNVPPITLEDAQKMSNQDLTNYVRGFRNSGEWRGPNVEGLSNLLENLITKDPSKFDKDLSLFIDLDYVYLQKVISGFINTWKNNNFFNWENVLDFCIQSLRSPKFYSEELKDSGDGWYAKSEYVVGIISELISTGVLKDDHAFSLELMPKTRQLLSIIVDNIRIKEVDEIPRNDYATYSLNSVNGKIVRAFLDYLLRIGRNSYDKSAPVKWSDSDKDLFEKLLKLNVLEAFIAEGLYFYQFLFLDQDWSIKQIENNQTLEDREWRAYFSGFCFSNPPGNRKHYDLLRPHYERAIENGFFAETLGHHGLIKHVVGVYLFGLDSLNDGLIRKLIDLNDEVVVKEIVLFISGLGDYFDSIEPEREETTIRLLMDLWAHLLNQFPDNRKILGPLTGWIDFVDVLNEENTNYLIKSANHIEGYHLSHSLIEELFRLKSEGVPSETAKYLGQILMVLDFKESPDRDQGIIQQLVEFLFQNNQAQLAKSICDNLARKQNDLLNDVYRKYT